MATLIDGTTRPEADHPDARAFLTTLSAEALEAVLETWLLPGMRIGEAGPNTWLAAALIRRELRLRDIER